MILTRLAEQYDRLLRDPRYADALPIRGESVQKISFEVVLDPDGTLVDVADLRATEGKTPVLRKMRVPGGAKPSGQGINACFLWDNARYLLGLDAEQRDPARTSQCFAASRQRHVSAARECPDEGLAAVAAFLGQWDPALASSARWNDERLATGFGVFRIRGATGWVHEGARVRDYLRGRAALSGEVTGQCLATGARAPLARLHEPRVKGAGGQSAGSLLVSFNEGAYESYGKDQSYNAPTGTDAVFRYANALNLMLADRSRTVTIGDLRVVFWAEETTPAESVFADLFGAQSGADTEDDARKAEVRRVFTQLRDGAESAEVLAPSARGTRFFVLGLAPNAARVVVRRWLDAQVGAALARATHYLREIALEHHREEAPLTVWRMVRACGRAREGRGGRKEYDADAVPPRLGADIARAILTGGAYPQTWLSTVVSRLRADGDISHPRIAGIKACLVRNSRLRGNPKELHMSLDTGQIDEGYLMGRLFALLEKTQEDSADGELNATIRDRYYASASATPAIAFPRLLRLTQHHLAKLAGGRKVNREKQLGEVMDKVRRFPHTLGLEQQGMFAIGYYQQRQALFTPRKDQENPTHG